MDEERTCEMVKKKIKNKRKKKKKSNGVFS